MEMLGYKDKIDLTAYFYCLPRDELSTSWTIFFKEILSNSPPIRKYFIMIYTCLVLSLFYFISIIWIGWLHRPSQFRLIDRQFNFSHCGK